MRLLKFNDDLIIAQEDFSALTIQCDVERKGEAMITVVIKNGFRFVESKHPDFDTAKKEFDKMSEVLDKIYAEDK